MAEYKAHCEKNTEIMALIQSLEFGDPIEGTYRTASRTIA